MELTFEVYGDVQLNRELLRFNSAVRDCAPAFEEIIKMMLEYNKHNFDSAGASSGASWPPLSDARAQAKASQGLDSRTLVATEDLMKSLTEEAGSNVEKEVTPIGFRFASLVPYGVFHQSDEPRESNLPQRKPVRFTEAQREGFVKVLQHWIMLGKVLR